MKFNLAHIAPDPRLHGLFGYAEVIETIQWGLEQLGHTVSRTTNYLAPDITNIVFGFQMLAVDIVRSLPLDTIVYNMEQVASFDEKVVRGSTYMFAVTRHRIWDFQPANVEVFRRLGPGARVRHVPVGYAPILTRITNTAAPDIDVLFYGVPNERRIAVFAGLCKAGLKCLFACGLYGTARDNLISRAKLVLNVPLYDGPIFETVRVTYLLANRKAVVCLRGGRTVIDDDLAPGLAVASPDSVVRECVRLANDTAARQRLETAGFDAITRRDITQILTAALAEPASNA